MLIQNSKIPYKIIIKQENHMTINDVSIPLYKRIVDYSNTEIVPDGAKVYKNQFSNLLEMVKYGLDIYNNNKLSALKDFVNSEYMYYFVIDMVFSSNDECIGDRWIDFDYNELMTLIESPFFDEYKQTIFCKEIRKLYRNTERKNLISSKRAFPFLDVYTYAKLQALGIDRLDRYDNVTTWYIWCYEDFVDQVLKYYYWDNIISTPYVKYGWKWYVYDNHAYGMDFILYQWSLDAIISTRRINKVSDIELKKDLQDMQMDCIIKLALSNQDVHNNEILKKLQEYLLHYDDVVIDELNYQKKKLEHKIYELKRDKETINRANKILVEQIRSIQKCDTLSEEAKINDILKRIYSIATKENADLSDDVKPFSEIWDNLSETTRTDIKKALSLYNLLNQPEYSILLLLRSMEREFNKHIFSPFKKSEFHVKITKPIYNLDRYSISAKMLYNKECRITIGSIPAIGGQINSIKAYNDSTAIARFVDFLGDKKNDIAELFKGIDRYRVGTSQLKISEIRNGVAHGNEEMLKLCDGSCYDDLLKLLYEPPIRIMFSLVKNSMK